MIQINLSVFLLFHNIRLKHFISSYDKMKKQKSSTIVLTEFLSLDDENEKAAPKIDKEELRKYLQNSDDDDESQRNKTSPQKVKKS